MWKPRLSYRKHIFGAGGILLLLAVLVGYPVPDPLFRDSYATVIGSRDGDLLSARIAADGQWRFPVPDSLPAGYIQCLTAYEDRYFFQHPGINAFSLLRAAWQNARAGRIVSGGSTLTMQLARMARGNRDRNMYQKAMEMWLALRIELKYSKEEILRLYAGHAPFGSNVVGINSAAWRYYNRSIYDLSWAEIANLTVLPNAPGLIFPGKGDEALRRKRDKVLRRLLDLGRIDSSAYRLALEEPVPEQPLPLPNLAGHLLDRSVGDHGPGHRLRSTLDGELQRTVVRIAEEYHDQYRHRQIHNAAAIVVEIATGEVKAYVGNVGDKSEGNHGQDVDLINSRRSPGSLLKPVLYALAIDEGLLLPTQLLPDIPMYYQGFAPRNFDHTFKGAVHAHQALRSSLNVPFVHLLKDYGYEKLHHRLGRLGIESLDKPAGHYGLTLILGGGEVTLWEMSALYAGMARSLFRYTDSRGRYRYTRADYHPNVYRLEDQGKDAGAGRGAFEEDREAVMTAREAAGIDRRAAMTNREVNRVYKAAASTVQASDRTFRKTVRADQEEGLISAGAIWHMLTGMQELYRPEEFMNWERFTSGERIAWKTGTSYGHKDAWAIGLNGKYVVGVWLGNADGEGRPDLTGVSAAAPLMFRIFQVLDGKAVFPQPVRELTVMDICRESGYRAGAHCPAKEQEYISRKALNTGFCPYHQPLHLDETRQYQVNSGCYPVHRMAHVNWFILPPAQAYYYRKYNTDYADPPEFAESCRTGEQEMMEMIYPRTFTRVYIPVEIDGSPGRVVFHATHRNPGRPIYWHLDDAFLGTTRQNHQMGLRPGKGSHVLSLVDDRGTELRVPFEVLSD